MADTLVGAVVRDATRGTGDGTGGDASSDTAGGAPGAVPPARPGVDDVAVRLVMTDRAVLDGADEPAHVDGYGPVPAGWARRLVTGVADRGGRVWLRRLFAAPAHGALVAMDSRSRLAPAGLADWVRTRDGGVCRTSWCDAPARHTDHVVPSARGGPTAADNLQSLCERCNYTKEAPGWSSEVDAGAPTHTVLTSTPTGHVHRSGSPPLPGADHPFASVIERWLAAQVAAVP